MTRLLVVNMNSHWMAKFWTRAEELARVAKKHDVGLISMQEAGPWDNGKHVSKLMGWGGRRVESDDDGFNDRPKRGDSFVLHGGFTPVTTALIWDPDLFVATAAGQVVTYKDHPRNKWATWAQLRSLATGFTERHEVTHLEFEPKGPNDKPYWDGIRRKQMDGLCTQLVKPRRTNLVHGDMNCDLNDPRDGCGQAWDEHKIVDCDISAKRKYNTDRSLTKAGWVYATRIGRIIRCGTSRDVIVNSTNTINMAGITDHNALLIDYTVPA